MREPSPAHSERGVSGRGVVAERSASLGRGPEIPPDERVYRAAQGHQTIQPPGSDRPIQAANLSDRSGLAGP